MWIVAKIKTKEIQIFNAKQIGPVSIATGDIESNVVQTGLELPSTREKGSILHGPTKEAVCKLVKTLREKEKVV